MRAGAGDGRELLHATAGVSLLFAVGARPAAGDIEHLLSLAAQPGASVSHRPPDEEGWIELLASGLTFDLHGLAPSASAPVPAIGHLYGLPADIAKFEFEAIALEPGAHIAAAGAMIPVVRVLVGLAAQLALRLPLTGVCWQPAQSWMEPKYFCRIVANWLSGGAFPALGLTGVVWRREGLLETAGLAFFVGQEVRLRQRPGETGSETIKLAGRIIDHLVRHGPVAGAQELVGLGPERLLAKPAPDGKVIEVSRSA
jgi:hypothetical protein